MPPEKPTASVGNLFLTGCVIALGTLGWYLPAFQFPVFHPDDITVFWHRLNWGVWKSNGGWVGNGRFLQWLIHASVMEHIIELKDYVLFRWLALLFGLFFGTVLLTRMSNIPAPIGTGLLALLFISPPFAVYFVQAHFVDILFAGGFAMLSSAAFIRLLKNRKRPIWYIVTGIAFAWICLHLHQAAWGFFLVPFIFKAATEETGLQKRSLLGLGLSIYVSISLFYWVYFNSLMNWLHPGSMLTERGSLPSGLSDRPAVFWGDYLYSSLSGYSLFINRWLAIATAILTSLLCLYGWHRIIGHHRGLGWQLLAWSALPAFLLLSVGPSIASNNFWFAYRLAGPLVALILVITCLGLWRGIQSPGRVRWIMAVGGLTWVGLYFGNSQWAVQEGLIRTQIREYKILRDFVQSSQFALYSKEWKLIEPERHRGSQVIRGKVEFGTYNSAQDFALVNYFQILSESAFGPSAGWWLRFQREKNWESYPKYGSNVISLDYLLDPHRPTKSGLHNLPVTRMPLLGDIYTVSKNRYFSPWMGYLDYAGYDAWHHPKLGRFSVRPDKENHLRMETENLGRLRLSPRSWPDVEAIDSRKPIRLGNGE